MRRNSLWFLHRTATIRTNVWIYCIIPWLPVFSLLFASNCAATRVARKCMYMYIYCKFPKIRPPSSKHPAPSLTPNFLHRYFPLCKRPVSSNFWECPVSFWFSSVIDWDYKEQREGAYAQDKLNIWANTPSPFLSVSSVQKGRRIFGSLRYIYGTVW